MEKARFPIHEGAGQVFSRLTFRRRDFCLFVFKTVEGLLRRIINRSDVRRYRVNYRSKKA